MKHDVQANATFPDLYGSKEDVPTTNHIGVNLANFGFQVWAAIVMDWMQSWGSIWAALYRRWDLHELWGQAWMQR